MLKELQSVLLVRKAEKEQRRGRKLQPQTPVPSSTTNPGDLPATTSKTPSTIPADDHLPHHDNVRSQQRPHPLNWTPLPLSDIVNDESAEKIATLATAVANVSMKRQRSKREETFGDSDSSDSSSSDKNETISYSHQQHSVL